jgi:hypothetical protein
MMTDNDEEEEEHELQPPNRTEAMEMTITNRELDDLGQRDGLAIQLRASALAQGKPPTPLPPPPALAPPQFVPVPPPTPWPWVPPVIIDLRRRVD